MARALEARLTRLETRAQGNATRPPRRVVRFIDDPEGADKCARENPDAFVISRIVVSPLQLETI